MFYATAAFFATLSRNNSVHLSAPPSPFLAFSAGLDLLLDPLRDGQGGSQAWRANAEEVDEARDAVLLSPLQSVTTTTRCFP